MQQFKKAFGLVQFDGSTVSGTSGSPYYLNNVCFGGACGMFFKHIGYSAPYLLSMARKEYFVNQESREDWLVSQVIKKGKRFSYKHTGIFDRYFVEVDGRVYDVFEDTMDELFRGGKGQISNDPMYIRESLDLAPREMETSPAEVGVYNDWGNFMEAEATRVVASAPGRAGMSRLIPQSNPTQSVAPSQNGQNVSGTRTSGSPGTGSQTSTTNQELTPVQFEQVSENTSKSLGTLLSELQKFEGKKVTLSKSNAKRVK